MVECRSAAGYQPTGGRSCFKGHNLLKPNCMVNWMHWSIVWSPSKSLTGMAENVNDLIYKSQEPERSLSTDIAQGLWFALCRLCSRSKTLIPLSADTWRYQLGMQEVVQSPAGPSGIRGEPCAKPGLSLLFAKRTGMVVSVTEAQTTTIKMLPN